MHHPTSLSSQRATHPQDECLEGSGVLVGNLKPIILISMKIRVTIINIYVYKKRAQMRSNFRLKCAKAPLSHYYVIINVIPPVALTIEELTAILAVGVNWYVPPCEGTTTPDLYEEVTNESASISEKPA